eukprot:2377867-Amphidinium_carterae.1
MGGVHQSKYVLVERSLPARRSRLLLRRPGSSRSSNKNMLPMHVREAACLCEVQLQAPDAWP